MSENAPSSSSNATDKSFSPVTVLPIEVAIGAATVPLLALLVGSRMMSTALQNLGTWSEELFRGDRLPSLHTPSAPPPSPNTADRE